MEQAIERRGLNGGYCHCVAHQISINPDVKLQKNSRLTRGRIIQPSKLNSSLDIYIFIKRKEGETGRERMEQAIERRGLNGGHCHCVAHQIWFVVKKASFKRVEEEHRKGAVIINAEKGVS